MQNRGHVAFLIAFLAVLGFASSASAATVTVTTAADNLTFNDGSLSLREAITAVNTGNSPGNPDVTAQGPGVFGTNDTINFNIAGAGVQRVLVGGGSSVGAFPAVVKPVNINGTTQGISSANTLANGDNAVTLILLDGSSAGPNASGLFLGAGSSGSTVNGLDVFGFGGGDITIQSNSNTVAGNFIGFDLGGAPALSPRGVLIQNSVSNTIGGAAPAARNVISGNFVDGVEILGSSTLPATSNFVQGNFIGTGVNGTSALGNGSGAPAAGGGGVRLVSANNNTIGGANAGQRNVISGNGVAGVLGDGAQNNILRGNFVGVGADGVTPVPNEAGVSLMSHSGGPAAQNNFIGGTGAGAGNLIAFNTGAGVIVNGAGAAANAILGNSINGNGGLGIDLGNDGVTANSAGGPHTGPNSLQNFPLVTAVSRGQSTTTIQGTLNATPSKTFRIEFFSSAACDPTGFGQGQTFLGFANATTDGAGNASFSAPLSVVVPDGASIAATATDPANNTSEFSGCFPPKTTTTTPPTTDSPPPATTSTTTPIVPPTPSSSFSALAKPRVNARTGAITFTESVVDPGTFSSRLTFPNGPFGVFAARAAKRCPAGQVRLKRKCRPSAVLFGQSSTTVAVPGRVTFTVKPSAAATKALKTALKHHRGVKVTAGLSFQSALGGGPASRTQAITVKLKKAKRR
jgi:hypothetical protein